MDEISNVHKKKDIYGTYTKTLNLRALYVFEGVQYSSELYLLKFISLTKITK